MKADPMIAEASMFGSQALETAIGLSLLFFVLATAASAIVEIFSRLLHKRAAYLQEAIKALLVGAAPPDPDPAAGPTTVTGQRQGAAVGNDGQGGPLSNAKPA